MAWVPFRTLLGKGPNGYGIGSLPEECAIKENRRGRCRVNAILTNDQVLEIMRRRDRLGQSVTKIATEMGLTKASVAGVVYQGNGTRTVLINGSPTKPVGGIP